MYKRQVLVTAGIELFAGLIESLAEVVPLLVEQLPVFIEGICTALIESMPILLEAGLQFFMALGQDVYERQTLNIAFGNASRTVPSSSITSSLVKSAPSSKSSLNSNHR